MIVDTSKENIPVEEKREVRICSDHQDYQVPLISTCSFMGAEFWCPYCGFSGGVFGAGKFVPDSEELKTRHTRYKKFSSDYLHAVGVPHCSSTLFNGQWVKPNDLPEEEIDRLIKIKKDWKYETKIETIELPETPEEK